MNTNQQYDRSHRDFIQHPFLLLLAGLVLSFYVTSGFAHHPHDVIDEIAVSPFFNEDRTAFFSSSDHLFRSRDGGQSWKERSNGLDNVYSVSSIDIAAGTDRSLTVYVATRGDGVYRSTDDGTSWTHVTPTPETTDILSLSARSDDKVLVINAKGEMHISNDAGASWHAAGLPEGSVITSLSPPSQSHSNVVLAGDKAGRVLLSKDQGRSWEISGQLEPDDKVTAVVLDPRGTISSSYFVATANRGVLATRDNGASFQPLNEGLPDEPVISLALSPNFAEDRTLYATTWHQALFVSTDAGGTWSKHGDGLTTSEQADSAKYSSPHFRQVKVATDNPSILFVAGFDGLFTSANGGHEWRELQTLPPRLIKGLGVSPARDGQLSLGVITYGGGAYITHDKGANWSIANNGLKNPRLGDIAFSPAFHIDSTLFTDSNGYLLRSTNRGASWEGIRMDLASVRRYITSRLIRRGAPDDLLRRFEKETDRRVQYPTVIALSPDFPNDGVLFFGTRWHGVYRSDDAGENYYNVREYTEGAVTMLALSPAFPRDETLFMFVRGHGLYKSTNGGEDWRQIDVGNSIGSKDSGSLNEKLARKYLVVSFSPDYESDRTLFGGNPRGLFKSTDNGETWVQVDTDKLPAGSNVLTVALSPDYGKDRTLLVSVKGHGLYRSSDGGETFSEIGHALREDNALIELLAYSSELAEDGMVYAASDEELYVSTDRGDNWTQIPRPVRYEDMRPELRYTGEWTSVEGDDYSASTVQYAVKPGARASLDFNGCGIRWISTRSPQGGKAKVFINGSLASSVDLHSPTREPMTDVFSETGLPCGSHSIAVEVDADAGAPAQAQVVLDAFDVLPAN
ncbi:MAG: hypothetical protein RQ736_13445 [Thiogranum sp.]|nr:hypothetical protein [Thiogranum sp.]